MDRMTTWRGLAWVIVLCIAGIAAGAEEQPEAAQPSPSNAIISIDIDTLLRSSPLVNEVSDMVWRLSARPGGQILALPVIVDRSGETEMVTLDPNTIKVRGGRFLAWRIPEQIGGGNGVPQYRLNEAGAGDARPPRLTRSLTITPRGVIEWSIDRRPLGGEVGESDNLYAMRLDPQRMREHGPGPSPRISRDQGESTKDYQARRQQELDAYRAQQDDFRDLQRRVQDLPTDFQEVAARADESMSFTAIYELTGGTRQITISGVQPDNWTIDLAQLEVLGTLGNRQTPAEFAQGARAIVLQPNAQTHAYTVRAIAYALSKSNAVQQMQLNDSLYVLLSRVLDSNVVADGEARRVVAEKLASVQPQTPATSKLLALASVDEDAGVQREVMSAADLPLMLDLANRMLRDPKAGQPSTILDKLLGRANEQNTARLISGVSFVGLKGSRREEAARAVLERAADETPGPARTVAAGWVDQRLLGATDPDLVQITLRLLDEADSGDSVVEPGVRAMLDTLFGPATVHNRDQGGLTLLGHIPVTSSGHNLFVVLQSGDAETRQFGWQALRQFVLETSNATASLPNSPGPEISAEAVIYDGLLSAALAEKPTPIEAVRFLIHQPDRTQATRALVIVAAEGEGPAVAAAARATIGSRRPLGEVLAQVTPDHRHAFADAVYTARNETPPPVTRMLSADTQTHTLATWFGQQVAQGNVPDAAQWAAGAGDENAVYDLVSHNDPQVGEAAVAALVAAAGGDPTNSKPLADKIRALSRTEVPSAWREQRRLIVLERMRTYVGPYELTVQVYGTVRTANNFGAQGANPSPPRPGMMGFDPSSETSPAPQGEPSQSFSLGVLNLRIDGNTLGFGTPQIHVSIPDESLGIRFDQPADLQNLLQDLHALPLENLPPVILHLDPPTSNRWRGWAGLPDTRIVELLLQPAAK